MLHLFEKFIKKENIFINEPMKNHTYFGIGGNADCFIFADTTEDIKNVYKICIENNIPFFVIGNGSNLLVSDDGVEGVVLKLSERFNKATLIEETLIKAECGLILADLANFALENSLTGFEFAHGIPGTFGGAVYMNAGAYDGEIRQVVETVDILSKDGIITTYTNDEMEFGYRKSVAQKNEGVILSATIRLSKGDKSTIKEKMDYLFNCREEKQPLDKKSAGSTFKRPTGFYAGKLIMDSGLRGFSIGDACVSEKHCGFVVNNGNATCKDILALIKHIEDTVYEKFNVKLETEIKFIGRK